ncbi:MAG: hypothetical protein EBY07_14270 [Actinobacteria bacterium]|nr:hypothetical protein [Actinomycetota bacterium]
MFTSVTAWLKLGGGVIAAVSLLIAGWHVASWRARAMETARLEAVNAELLASMDRMKAAQAKADRARVEDAVQAAAREADLQAQIQDLQELVDIEARPDCDFKPEVAGLLNRAMGRDK